MNVNYLYTVREHEVINAVKSIAIDVVKNQISIQRALHRLEHFKAYSWVEIDHQSFGEVPKENPYRFSRQRLLKLVHLHGTEEQSLALEVALIS